MPIIGPLPAPFADGGIGEASQVMDNFNWILAQINANAALGGNQGQWPSSGLTPTYVNTFAFSVPGDQRAKLPLGRSVQAVIANGFVYGPVAVSSFGGGITTVTLNLNNSPVVLDPSISAINLGLLTVADNAIPASTDLRTFPNFTVLPGSSLPVLGQQAVAVGDVLAEWFITGPLGGACFVATYPGNYHFQAKGYLAANGADITQLSQFIMRYRLNFGSTPAQSLQNLSWPYASGVQSNTVPFSGQMAIALNAGDQMQIDIQTPFFNSGTMQWYGGLAIRRLSY